MTKLKLSTLLGNYPNAQALKSGAVKSDLVEFDFADVKVPNTAFKALVREAKFDVAELAIVTFLQAKTYGKPYVLIPTTVLGRGQHHTIAYNPERGPLKASELAGKRVGVRAYTVTTGAWVRGFLADDYGVDPTAIRWVSFEDPHLAEYQDPDFVTRAPTGKTLAQMLLDRRADAVRLGRGQSAGGGGRPRVGQVRRDPAVPGPQAAERRGPLARQASRRITRAPECCLPRDQCDPSPHAARGDGEMAAADQPGRGGQPRRRTRRNAHRGSLGRAGVVTQNAFDDQPDRECVQRRRERARVA